MRHLILSLLLVFPALPAASAECGSIVPSVCAMPLEGPAPVRKVIKVKPTVTPYVVGDRFPFEDHFFVMDPVRYGLAPSDGPGATMRSPEWSTGCRTDRAKCWK